MIVVRHEEINEHIKNCHYNSVKGGWWEGDTSIFHLVTKICLMHSEIDEAMDGVEGNLKDDKLPDRSMEEVEMADVLIRIFDYMGYRKMTVDENLVFTNYSANSEMAKFCFAERIHKCVTKAMEGLRKDDRQEEYLGLLDAIGLVYSYCNVLQLDVRGAIRDKARYNAVRKDHKLENRKSKGGKRF